MFKRLACRTAGHAPSTASTAAGEASNGLFTAPLLVIALALIGLGVGTANPLSAVIGGLCLVAALSKAH